ncbi:hypothetical protein C8Q79DRAFT_548000 [Trametes meyenii]|nr:hypothetical protein C8Q79DRAFT_548000 [Trametes meyenii]
MDNFPVELIDAILEHTYYEKGFPDKNSLRMCTLVSRTWTEPAQRLLFRRVALQKSEGGRKHMSFREATDPRTDRGRMLGQYVRVLDIFVGQKSTHDLDCEDMANLLRHTPRLYELVLHVSRLHQFSVVTIQKLARLAVNTSCADCTSSSLASCNQVPLRIRALTIVACGVQSPILYQLLEVWPTIEFLHIGVEIAAPPPKWAPQFHLYQLSLMRTPPLSVLSWLLSTSVESLRIVSFRDVPGRALDPLLEAVGPRLRSLGLMNYNLRAAAVLEHCPNLEEFIVVQPSTLIPLRNLPGTLEHLGCRILPSIGVVTSTIASLPHLRVVTCDSRAAEEETYVELEGLCTSRGIELFLDDVPFWVREDPIHVKRFPRRRAVANFASMS